MSVGFSKLAPRPRPPRELLVEFFAERNKTFYRIELVDHGPEIGVEGQLINNGEMQYAPRFPTREAVLQWAAEVRKDVETGRFNP